MKTLVTCAIISVLSIAAPSGAMAAGRGMAPVGTQRATPATATQTAPPTTLSPRHVTGQPNQNCETTGSPPGGAASAPGSAFNPSGTAGGVYAGQQTQNSRNTASVAQYDVACARHR
jgi:hypothetical protein